MSGSSIKKLRKAKIKEGLKNNMPIDMIELDIKNRWNKNQYI